MPYYEYFCGCGHKFEVRSSMEEVKEYERCPMCRRLGKKILSTFIFKFKEAM